MKAIRNQMLFSNVISCHFKNNLSTLSLNCIVKNVHKMNLRILSSLALFGFLFSCKTQLTTVKPTESYLAPVIENKPSTIALAIDLDVPELEKGLNNTFKGVIYEDNNITDDNLMVKVTKQQDIHFSVVGNTINGTLPLKIWVKYRYQKTVLGVTVNSDYEATGAMNIDASSVFSLTKDWRITTATTIGKYVWTEAPKINAIGMNIPVTFIADMAIKSLKGKITSAIDKSIAEDLNLRNTMEQTWNTLQTPVNINTEHNVWLKINPLSIYSSPIVGTGKKLSFNLGINTMIETSVGSALEPAPTKTKLPDYQTINAVKPEFLINTNINVSYQKITDIAQKYVVGQEFKDGKKHVTIKNINMFGKGDTLVVVIDVEGSANGTIYCVGKLQFDAETEALKITNFDFEVKTRNALLKTANWLMHKSFLKMVEPMLTIPVKDQMQGALTAGNDFMKGYQIRKGVMLKGSLNKVLLDKITITPQAIVIGGNISGSMKIELGDLL